ncbi:hypothetical protein A7U60_g6367 [Sanghuangporus baumii]|uniref:R3H domain-containing protein n=1 Tax=Sanghuangporus baumii TaxID=108892 RepID=A0A9Q5HV73_SANBA|nr:hypothetical protein A7U60_g6367 [Sanghuangporus baumii]
MPTSTTALDSFNNTAANLSTSTLPSTNTSHIQTTTEVSEQNKRRRRPHKPWNEENNNRGHDETEGSREGEHVGTRHRSQGRRRDDGPRHKPVGQTRPPFQEDASAQSGRSSPAKSQKAQERHGRGRGRGRGPDGLGRGQDGPPRGRGGGGRRKQINAKLTSADADNSSEKGAAPTSVRTHRRNEAAKPDTLTNRLIDSLRTPPYADCPICFNSIHPAQPIWSCSPSGQQVSSSAANDSDETPRDTQCCYTPFHLKCIKSWASKSVKDMRDAYLARGETGKQGEWRCPGYQVDSIIELRLIAAETRALDREFAITPAPFHATLVRALLVRSQRKYHAIAVVRSNLFDCGRHRCMKACHPGNCEECPIIEEARCYCGKTSKPLRCGEGEEKHSSVVLDDGVLEEWDGRFTCESSCGRLFDCGIHILFDCGIHMCEKPCHPPSTSPPPCPRSPSLVSHCPCGKKPLFELEGGTREKCTDPIATCGNMCMKRLEGCDHACSVPSVLAGGAKGKGKKLQSQLNQGLDYALGDEAHWHECDLVCDVLKKRCPAAQPAESYSIVGSTIASAFAMVASVHITDVQLPAMHPPPAPRTSLAKLQLFFVVPVGGYSNHPCVDVCAIAKRNARLAEALGISREVQDRDGQRPVTYSSDLTAFAHANARFCAVVEKTFADFINSDRKSQILPHMHEVRRKFVHDLASIYRMDTQMVDQEPMRSVQLIRRIDTRIPKPLLSSVATPSLNVGKFADLRSSANIPVARPTSAAGVPNSNVNSAPSQNANRGWTSVVAARGTSTAQAGKSGSAWDAPDRSLEARHTRGASPARHGNIEVIASRIATSVRDDSVPDDWENDEV